MPPVKTVASSTDVDNDATAELPVLDVAAYEATLDESESISNTDTWSVPSIAASASSEPGMPVAEAIPTLRPAEPQNHIEQGILEDHSLDLSGTHEMPAFKPNKASPNKITKATPVPPTVVAAPAAVPVARVIATPSPVTLPPHPPMIEELRGALAAAERRIEELNERARIADAERGVAVARANAESAQLREQLDQHLESLQSVRGRLDLERSDLPALEDELFARADRIATLERELAAQAGDAGAGARVAGWQRKARPGPGRRHREPACRECAARCPDRNSRSRSCRAPAARGGAADPPR